MRGNGIEGCKLKSGGDIMERGKNGEFPLKKLHAAITRETFEVKKNTRR